MRYFYHPGNKDTYEHYVAVEDHLPLNKKYKPEAKIYKFVHFWYRKHDTTEPFNYIQWYENSNGVELFDNEQLEISKETLEEKLFLEMI